MKKTFSLMSALIFTLVSLPLRGQDLKTKVVEKTHYEGPVEVLELEIEGQKFNFLDRVVAGKNWLKLLRLNVRNNYSRSVAYMEIELEIAPVGKMERPLRLPVVFGEMPPAAGAKEASAPTEKLAPKGMKKLALSKAMQDVLTDYMREKEIEDIDAVKVIVEFIIFDDGTAWNKGHTMRRDPTNPERWVVDGVWPKGRAADRRKPYSGPRSGPLSFSGQNSTRSRTALFNSDKWTRTFTTNTL